jgi:hypothetical protein
MDFRTGTKEWLASLKVGDQVILIHSSYGRLGSMTICTIERGTKLYWVLDTKGKTKIRKSNGEVPNTGWSSSYIIPSNEWNLEIIKKRNIAQNIQRAHQNLETVSSSMVMRMSDEDIDSLKSHIEGIKEILEKYSK